MSLPDAEELRRASAEWERRQRALVPDHETLVMRRDSVLAEIELAFSDVTREGGMSITEADAADGGFCFMSRAEARALDHDLHWSEVDLPNKDGGGSALSFMDPIGFRYHIPAYMSFALRHGYPAVGPVLDDNCGHCAIHHLTQAGEEMSRSDRETTEERTKKPEPPYSARFLEIMSDSQLRACARFVLFDSLAGDYCTTTDPAGPLWWADHLDTKERSELMAMWKSP